MTIVNENGKVTASFQKTHDVSIEILKLLEGSNVQIGYGMLACALTLGRLSNPTTQLSDEEEVAFVQAVMEFTGAYFPDDTQGN